MSQDSSEQHGRSGGEVTRLLADLYSRPQAERPPAGPRPADELLPLAYDELRGLAGAFLREEKTGHTLQATALVHEAYLKLVGQTRAKFADKAHFLRVAGQAMRRILVDHARIKNAAKRGSGAARLPLDAALDEACARAGGAAEVVALDGLLDRLAEFDPGKARVVELRFFAGLTSEEAAEALCCSARTVEREWTIARAWLRARLDEHAGPPQGAEPLGSVP